MTSLHIFEFNGAKHQIYVGHDRRPSKIKKRIQKCVSGVHQYHWRTLKLSGKTAKPVLAAWAQKDGAK